MMMNPIVFMHGLDVLTQSSAAVHPEEEEEDQGQLKNKYYF